MAELQDRKGAVHAAKDHAGHMNAIGGFVQDGDGLLMRTRLSAIAKDVFWGVSDPVAVTSA